MVVIDAEVSQVVKDLQAMIPEIRVRLAEDAKPPYYAVYLLPEGGCPCPDPVCEHGHLVLTAQATLTSSGTLAGLDERIVQRVAQIDPHGRGHYDYLEEIDKQNTRARARARERQRERFDEIGEQAQRELRDRLGPSHRQIFVSKDVA
jgi:hypothetical protein